MGIEKQRCTVSLDARHIEFLDRVQLAAERDNRSQALRSFLDGVYALMVTGKMPQWMVTLQQILRVKRYEDSGEDSGAVASDRALNADLALRSRTDLLSASAAETGRRDAASGVPVKRPPLHIQRAVFKMYRLTFPDGRQIVARHFVAQEIEMPMAKAAAMRRA